MAHDSMPLADFKAGLAAAAARPLDEATTMPPGAYSSQAVLDLEFAEIFAKEWICLGRVEEVPKTGDYFTTRIGGERLIVVRATDGDIRVLSNVCRHRWTQVATGAGHTRRFVCPYHAWTYDLEGRLVWTRFMEGQRCFDRESHRLPRVRSEIWRGFIYANLDHKAAPLAPRLEALDALIDGYHMEEMRLLFGDDEVWANNWKLLVENFTEAYHSFQAHKNTINAFAPSELSEIPPGGDGYSLMISPIDPKLPPRTPHHPDLPESQRYHITMICVFPSHVIALAPERAFYMCLTPEGTGQVRTKWGVAGYGPAPAREAAEHLEALYREVNEEDRVRLESIQENVGSRFAGTGPISHLEKPNWDFTRYIARRLAS